MKYGRIVVVFGKRKAYRAFDKKSIAREFLALARERFGETHVYLVRYRAKPRPRGLLFRQTWCPYCWAERKFKQHSVRKLRCCEICGISENDYYVQETNPSLVFSPKPKRTRFKKISTVKKEEQSKEDAKRAAKKDRARKRREARRSTNRGH